MSSPVELPPEQVRAELSRLLDRKVTGLERIGGGFNSRVYTVSAADGQRFALKMYFRQAADQRDRLATEFGSFAHLWASGFRQIPQPLISDEKLGWAIYQYIEGEKIPRDRIDEPELEAAADFLARLRTLSRDEASRRIGLASEAYFSADKVVENVQRRLTRLETADTQTLPGQALHEFLEKDFKPFFARVTDWSAARLQATGMGFTQELDWDKRTLSPSDFGFHNALRQNGGGIIFLDFEYFGWDDPAKMISDFVLHPAMELSKQARKIFASTLFRRFSDWPGLPARTEAVYPLFGLKWCTIILNEFLPDQLLRRQFAAVQAADRSALQMQQLAKARHMLGRIREEYEHFPYRD